MAESLGRYELIEVLAVRPTTELFLVRVSGEGGFHRRIALKRLRDDKRAAQFIEDATLGANLSHPKIVELIELGSLSGVPYVAMEYVDGVDLLGLLGELSRAEKLIEPSIAVWIVHELLGALDYAHNLVDEHGTPRGISHGRLTPSKVMIGVGGEIKLRDFGGARAHGLDVDRAGNNYAYAAPEQVADLPSDARTDIYAAGVVLAELLIGRRLFAAPNEFDLLMRVRDGDVARFDARAAEIGGDLVDLVHTALDRRIEHRFPTAATFRDALADWLFEHRHRVSHLDVAKIVTTVRADVDAWRRANGSKVGPTLELADVPVTSQPTTLPPVKFDWSEGGAGIKPRTRTVEIPPLVRPASTDPASPRAPKPGLKVVRPRVSTRGMLHPQRVTPSAKEGMKPLARPVWPQDTPADSIGAAVESILPERTAGDTEDQPAHVLSAKQAALAAQVPPPMLANLTRTADEAGQLSRIPALRMVFRLMYSKASGLLAIASGEIRRDLYFRNGQLAGVWSGVTGDLFGSYLVANQILSNDDVAAALADVATSGGRLGDAVVRLKLLKPVEVFRHLTRHVRAKVIEICTMSDGFFAWYRGADLREAFSLEAEGFTILGEAAEELPAATLEAWIVKHHATRWVPALAPRVGAEAFGLGGADTVLVLLDGVRTVDDLLGLEAADTRLGIARRLYLLEACDLIRPADD